MTKETFMIEEISKDIVLLLMEEQGMSLEEAIIPRKRTGYRKDSLTCQNTFPADSG